MPNLINVTYSQTGNSIKTNEFGMREMQSRAYEKRKSQYLLLKAPPASGKSRALMYIALDKLKHQGIKKVIIAVPEKSISKSFMDTDLKSQGFFENWKIKPENNLCTPGGDQAKVQSFVKFMQGDGDILLCTHATLRFAFEAISEDQFDNCMLAIDEFHHVSADSVSRLGDVLRSALNKSKVHILAMTGSYFRGDNIPILLPEDENKFVKVTYTYYDQLNGYKYLKSLGLGYHFYQGKYTSAINDVLDINKKTILHIPSVQSGESTKEKYNEVDTILDLIGEVTHQDPNTGVIFVKCKNQNKIIKVADLVQDESKAREKIIEYLRQIKSPEDMDLIIALGMAKEGFDWEFCEHSLTVGYRGSLTEVIQIIGRCTRDSVNKTNAQFTNLIAQPDAEDDQVKVSVNNMLKAITCSLLMEQVLAPNFKFRSKESEKDNSSAGTIKINGFREPSTLKVKNIIETDLNDLKAYILQDEVILKAIPGNIEPEVINKVLIPKIIKEKYPDLNENELEELRQYVVVDSVIKLNNPSATGDSRFIKLADSFVNIDDLHIDLIDSINPFQKCFEILSKSVTSKILKVIQDYINAGRIQMTDEEAIILWPKINNFVQANGREPDFKSEDPLEKRLAEAIIYLKEQRRLHGL